jgi:hypothetical protein
MCVERVLIAGHGKFSLLMVLLEAEMLGGGVEVRKKLINLNRRAVSRD